MKKVVAILRKTASVTAPVIPAITGIVCWMAVRDVSFSDKSLASVAAFGIVVSCAAIAYGAVKAIDYSDRAQGAAV
ncbi:MAG: hypothetical protein ACO20P_05800 [bacterium]|jgi:hypothetical protein